MYGQEGLCVHIIGQIKLPAFGILHIAHKIHRIEVSGAAHHLLISGIGRINLRALKDLRRSGPVGIVLWRECFDDTDQYVDMFFSEVYRDEDALVLEEEGRIVSSMMLQRYTMNFHGVTSSVSYVCGAATAKSLRGHRSSDTRQTL